MGLWPTILAADLAEMPRYTHPAAEDTRISQGTLRTGFVSRLGRPHALYKRLQRHPGNEGTHAPAPDGTRGIGAGLTLTAFSPLSPFFLTALVSNSNWSRQATLTDQSGASFAATNASRPIAAAAGDVMTDRPGDYFLSRSLCFPSSPGEPRWMWMLEGNALSRHFSDSFR